MNVLKVIGGTRPSRDLCADCAAVVIIRGAADSDETRYCRTLHRPIKTLVSECTEYLSNKEPGIRQYDRMAWHLDFDRQGPVFVSPRERNSDRIRVHIRRKPRRKTTTQPTETIQ